MHATFPLSYRKLGGTSGRKQSVTNFFRSNRLDRLINVQQWKLRHYTLISTSTPAAKSILDRASMVCGVGSRISSKRRCVRISNCSRDFLSTWGPRLTVKRSIQVGSGIGPRTCAPVRFAVLMISPRSLIQQAVIVPFQAYADRLRVHSFLNLRLIQSPAVSIRSRTYGLIAVRA